MATQRIGTSDNRFNQIATDDGTSPYQKIEEKFREAVTKWCCEFKYNTKEAVTNQIAKEFLDKHYYDSFAQLGVYSVGFLFRSAEGGGSFVRASGTTTTYNFSLTCERSNGDASPNNNNVDLIDNLFMIHRDHYPNEGRTEYINELLDQDHPKELYYVPLGKTLFWCCLWRYCMWKEQSESPVKLDSVMATKDWQTKTFYWRSIDKNINIAQRLGEKNQSLPGKWSVFLRNKFPQEKQIYWRDELRALHLIDNNDEVLETGQILLEYLSESAKTICPDESFVSQLNAALENNSKEPFYDKDNYHKIPIPILGMWIYNVYNNDSNPVTYLATTVWLGMLAPTQDGNKPKIPNFGVALCAISPMSDENEKRVLDKWQGVLSPLCRMLRTLAEPLVDLVYYDNIRSALLVKSNGAARTAILARNFSHVLGSHVVSNPHFRDALLDETWLAYRTKLESHEKTFRHQAEALASRVFDSADPLREMHTVWEEAEDTLRRSHDQLYGADTWSGNTRVFHEYLQGRFDYIARAIGNPHDPPEPVFFVSELLYGFLKQTALLDTVVQDLGLGLHDMRIHVIFANEKPEPKQFYTEWNGTEQDQSEIGGWGRWVDATGGGADIGQCDKLLGLPGGMVSAHAFYSFLENVIRNSAKYGSYRFKKGTEGKLNSYCLFIQLEYENGASDYSFKLFDNYSGNLNEEQFKHIKEPIYGQNGDADADKKGCNKYIEKDGQPTSSGLGVLEMWACAESLKNGGKLTPRQEKVTEEPFNAIKIPNRDDHKFKPLKEVFGNEVKILTYSFAVSKPILLAIVSPTSPGNSDYQAPTVNGGIARFTSLDTVLKYGRGAHLVVVDGETTVAGFWGMLKERHSELPYRLLVLTKHNSNWTHPLETNCPRRVFSVADDDLYAVAFETTSADIEHNEVGSAHALVLDIYKRWMLEWEKSKTQNCEGRAVLVRHLWIGLDRGEDQVKGWWEDSIRKSKGEEGSDGKQGAGYLKDFFVSLNVKSRTGKDVISTATEMPALHAAYDKKALVFDNHGSCFPELSGVEGQTDFTNCVRFYQKLSGSETPDLFRLLSHPPSSEFGFAFFVLSLAEACLANIAVVDERIANDLLKNHGAFSLQLANHQKAGVFPAFAFCKKSDGSYCFIISPTDAPQDAGSTHPMCIPINDGENPKEVWRTVSDAFEFPKFDAIVIHEGVMDRHGKEIGWEKKTGLAALYQIAPVVARTSGRGRASKLLGTELPFIEFGAVSSALLTSRNKFSLVRSLFGATGDPASDEDNRPTSQ